MTQTGAFPVTWDDPRDAERSWRYDTEHLPDPVKPLDYDLQLGPFLKGFGWFDVRYVNYYVYVAPPQGPAARAGAGQRADEDRGRRRALA